MRISEMFRNGRKVLSFEVFPPKSGMPLSTVLKTLEELKSLNPSFISVTYGAGGSEAAESTLVIASKIKNELGTEALAHLTCVNSTIDQIDGVLEDFYKGNIENILALRGDITEAARSDRDFKYAADLIERIKKDGRFSLSGGCYPETHPEAESPQKDIDCLKKKVHSGCDHLISQLFFDNSTFFGFMDKIRSSGISVPVQAGIMPITNKNQAERVVSMCGARITSEIKAMLQKYGDDAISLKEAGIEFAAKQIESLMHGGADGVHLYTMNNSYVAKKIHEKTNCLF